MRWPILMTCSVLLAAIAPSMPARAASAPAAVGAAAETQAASCARLASLRFEAPVGAAVSVRSAARVGEAGDLPAYCRVVASIAPRNTVEIRLPITFGKDTTPVGSTVATPTPNAELRNPTQRWLTVQWVDAQPSGPPCDSPGVLTDWSLGNNGKAIPRDAAIGLRAPAGAAQVVQIALNQVGKRYVWGSTGPTPSTVVA